MLSFHFRRPSRSAFLSIVRPSVCRAPELFDALSHSVQGPGRENENERRKRNEESPDSNIQIAFMVPQHFEERLRDNYRAAAWSKTKQQLSWWADLLLLSSWTTLLTHSVLTSESNCKMAQSADRQMMIGSWCKFSCRKRCHLGTVPYWVCKPGSTFSKLKQHNDNAKFSSMQRQWSFNNLLQSRSLLSINGSCVSGTRSCSYNQTAIPSL